MREGYEPARPNPVVRLKDARGGASAVALSASVTMAADAARFFQELRGALQLSPAEAAQALATRIDIITALETGNIGALPPWTETCRIVRSYAGFAALDPRPILHVLEQLTAAAPIAAAPGATAVQQATPSQALVPVVARQERRPMWKSIGGGGRRAAAAARNVQRAVNDRAGRPGMALFTVTLGVALIVLLTQSAVLEAAVSQLPPSMKRVVRGAQNYIIVRFAPVRDGLRWIDVPDPRTRRGDKLQTAAQ